MAMVNEVKQRRMDQFFAPKDGGKKKRKAEGEVTDGGNSETLSKKQAGLGERETDDKQLQLSRAEINKAIAIGLARTRKLRER